LESDSSAVSNNGLDVILYVGSSSTDFDISPNVCRGNPTADFGSVFDNVCMGLVADCSVVGFPTSPHDTDNEPIERIELMAIAAVEVGSKIQRKLLEDLEKIKISLSFSPNLLLYKNFKGLYVCRQ